MRLTKHEAAFLGWALTAACAVACSSPPGHGPTTPTSTSTCVYGADSGANTTAGILTARGPDCLGCARRNGCLIDAAGKDACCETIPGATAGGVTEAALCVKTMHDILRSNCATVPGPSLDIGRIFEPGCLCGKATDANLCLAGTATATGPVYPDYVDDWGRDVGAIDTNFVSTDFGAGEANNILECAFSYQCQCFGTGVFDAGVGDSAKLD
jgi:hypothetical protein